MALVAFSLILFFTFIAATFFLLTRSKYVILRVCIVLFSFSVAVGFIVHAYSHMTADAGFFDIFLAVLRGIFSAARMFFINDDYEILMATHMTQYFAMHQWLQILFWLGHVSALIVIQATLFSLFGRRLADSLRLQFGLHKEVFIVKGGDKYAVLLGENIATHDSHLKPANANRLIVFLLEDDSNIKTIREKVSHFNGVVKVLDRKSNLPFYLGKSGLGKWRCRNKIYKILLTQDNVSAVADTHQAVEYANQRKVDPSKLDIYVLTSSEWNREKIESITWQKVSNQRKYPYTIHIINEIDLMTRQMIKEHPPYECPGLSLTNNGMAGKDFNVMILGFGAVGQSALLRLIMNGQFVGSRMRATVIDREMEHVKEHFLHCYPALGLCCEIYGNLKCLDVRSEEFFALLNEVQDVDYIVVALGDDELNKQVALDIRLYHQRKGAGHLPFIAVYEKNGVVVDENQDDALFTFGCREEIYKNSVIIRKDGDCMAMALNDTYNEMYKSGAPWHQLEWFHQESSRAAADFIPAMLKLAGLEHESAEEIAKKERLTKDRILAEVLAQTEHLRWMAFHAAMGYRPISIDKMQQRFNETKNLGFCRRDMKAKQHATLVPWDELDDVSAAYSELAKQIGDTAAEKTDFKEVDRNIVVNIPKFLRAASSGNRP